MEHSLLSGWENFYVITGSCAGGLTGLMFVVITLMRDPSRVRVSGLRAFVTPTIVHFCAVLSLSCFLNMPHASVPLLSAGFAVAGVAGVLYCGVIAFNMSRSSEHYTPERDDWAWNVYVPTFLYAGSIAAAVCVREHPSGTLYGVAAIALGLLLLGIRNSWDLAVFMTLSKRVSAAHEARPGGR